MIKHKMLLIVSVMLILVGVTFSGVTAAFAKAKLESAAPGSTRPDGPLQKYLTAAMAESLGITVEDLQKRLEAGERMWDIAKEKGVSPEDFRTKMDEAFKKAIAAALAAGDITQEQADQRAQNRQNRNEMGRGGMRNGDKTQFGPMRDYMQTAMANVLGITTEELKSRFDAGEKMLDIIQKQGLTVEEFHTKMVEAGTKAINQAVADGKLTQEQADRIIENMKKRPSTGLGGGGRGRGGMHGGGNGTPAAPGSTPF